MQDWLKGQLSIGLASTWEDGCIESLHDKLREECLNRKRFRNLHFWKACQ